MQKHRLAAFAVALGSAVLLWNCGGSAPSSPTPGGGGGTGGGGSTPPPPPPSPVQIVAAGDIGECGFGAQATGKMLDNITGSLLALGDLAYYDGSRANFRDCYDPAWGRHQSRTRPVPGNHEYTDRSASGYWEYFGELAGQPGQGYYAWTEGAWRIIALNSEIPMTLGSPQQTWLKNELATNRFTCTLAYWHRPRWSSGPNFPQQDVDPLWRTVQEGGVDVVLNGHDHMYERFAPQDANGKPSPSGTREFIVGTGGAHLYIPGAAQPNSEFRASVYGLLIMTLSAGSYQWDFVSVSNTPVRDTNSGQCH
jgi:hypothetical protein